MQPSVDDPFAVKQSRQKRVTLHIYMTLLSYLYLQTVDYFCCFESPVVTPLLSPNEVHTVELPITLFHFFIFFNPTPPGPCRLPVYLPTKESPPSPTSSLYRIPLVWCDFFIFRVAQEFRHQMQGVKYSIFDTTNNTTYFYCRFEAFTMFYLEPIHSNYTG